MDKKTKLSEAISYIDDDLIEEADEVRRNSVSMKGRVVRIGKWAKYGTVAAASVLVVGGGIYAATRFANGTKASDEQFLKRAFMSESADYSNEAPQSVGQSLNSQLNVYFDMSSFSCRITDVTNVSAKILFDFSKKEGATDFNVTSNEAFAIESFNSDNGEYKTLYDVGYKDAEPQTFSTKETDKASASDGAEGIAPQISIFLDC